MVSSYLLAHAHKPQTFRHLAAGGASRLAIVRSSGTGAAGFVPDVETPTRIVHASYLQGRKDESGKTRL
jgi:hypothetical protein